MDEKILTKIRNLLKLGESPSVHEAALAMSMARKLMLKYNIEESHLESKTEQTVLEGDLFGIKSKRSKWETLLSNQIFKVFSVVLIIRQKSNTAYMFSLFGHKDDITIGKYMYTFAMEAIEKLYDMDKKGKFFETDHQRKIHRESFKYGAAIAIVENIKKQYQPTQEENALVLSRLHKAQNFVDQNLNCKTTKSRAGQMNGEAYINGYNKGKQVSLNRPIEASENNNRMIA